MDGSIYGSSAFARSKPSLQIREHLLEPLSEDDTSQGVDSSRPSLEGTRLDNFLSPTFGSYSDKGLKRSASTAQMRDLKDQMKDLKGRLSTLRDQAREDSLKRRSLQSLRTPSPFTHAQVDQWYAGTAKYEDEGSVHSDYKSQLSNEDASIVNGGERDLAVKQMSPHASEESIPNGYSTVEESEPSPLSNGEIKLLSSSNDDPPNLNQVGDDADDMRTENGSDEELDEIAQEEEDDEIEAETDGDEQSVFDDSASESGASSYYDSVQNQVSHEDREDAFDYEHFFLHSAMGSMSRSRMRKGSRESFSSEDSVETTRGPVATSNTRSTAGKAGSRSRRGSHGSVSSIESFATATEGRLTRAENEAAEAYHGHGVIIPQRARTHTPDGARRTRLSTETSDSGSDNNRTKVSNIRRPQSSAATFMHRPSVSSFDSSRTHRSFPLVNKPKVNGGILTPRDSPDRELKRISEVFLNESLSSIQGEDNKMSPIEMLQRDDRILVERLIGSLGKCVLGLAESGRGSADYRAQRRKIEAAKRVLESLEAPA